MPLTRNQIVGRTAPTEEVYLEEFEGSVVLRPLSGRETLTLLVNSSGSEAAFFEQLLPFLAKCVLDGKGQPLLEEADLDKLPASVLTKLLNKLVEISKLGVVEAAAEGKGD